MQFPVEMPMQAGEVLWYRRDAAGQAVGPLLQVQMLDLVTRGELRPDDWVRSEHDQDWQYAAAHPQLFPTAVVAPSAAVAIPAPAETAPPMSEPSPSLVRSWEDVPWYRRSGWVTAFIIAGVLLLPPLLWAACLICLTGEVYNNRVRRDGTLVRWSSLNKVAAVVIVLFQSAILARWLGLWQS